MCANENSTTHGRWTSERPEQALPLEPEVLRQPDDGRREQRPEVPVGAVEDDERSASRSPVRPSATRELPGERRRQEPEQRRPRASTSWPAARRSAAGGAGRSSAGAAQIELPIRRRFHAVTMDADHTGRPRYRFVRRKTTHFVAQRFALTVAPPRPTLPVDTSSAASDHSHHHVRHSSRKAPLVCHCAVGSVGCSAVKHCPRSDSAYPTIGSRELSRLVARCGLGERVAAVAGAESTDVRSCERGVDVTLREAVGNVRAGAEIWSEASSLQMRI